MARPHHQTAAYDPPYLIPNDIVKYGLVTPLAAEPIICARTCATLEMILVLSAQHEGGTRLPGARRIEAADDDASRRFYATVARRP